MRLRTKAALGGVLAAAAFGGAPAGASAACVGYEEPFTYSGATVCADEDHSILWVSASASVACDVRDQEICAMLLGPVEVGKTGWDRYSGEVWVNGEQLKND